MPGTEMVKWQGRQFCFFYPKPWQIWTESEFELWIFICTINKMYFRFYYKFQYLIFKFDNSQDTDLPGLVLLDPPEPPGGHHLLPGGSEALVNHHQDVWVILVKLVEHQAVQCYLLRWCFISTQSHEIKWTLVLSAVCESTKPLWTPVEGQFIVVPEFEFYCQFHSKKAVWLTHSSSGLLDSHETP